MAEEDTARLSDEYRDYIDQRVLWIRSHPPLLASFSQAGEATDDDVEPTKREALVADDVPKLMSAMLRDARRNPVIYFCAGLLAGLLLFLRPIVARHLQHIAERARGSAYSHFTPSLHALVLNVISCLLGQLTLGFLAWRFARISDPAGLSQAVSSACFASGLILLPLSLANRVFATNGLADAHFGLVDPHHARAATKHALADLGFHTLGVPDNVRYASRTGRRPWRRASHAIHNVLSNADRFCLENPPSTPRDFPVITLRRIVAAG